MSEGYDLELADVLHQASGSWVSVLSNLAPALNDALAKPGRHGSCPAHGGSDGFRVYKDVDQTGGGICNSCTNMSGQHGWSNGIALLMWANDWDFRTTLEAVATCMGLEFTPKGSRKTPILRQSPVPVEKGYSITTEKLQSVWEEAVPLTDMRSVSAMRYFATRGLAYRHVNLGDVAFHPSLSYWHEGSKIGDYPCILARIRDAKLQPVTIHRIYITKDGKKAEVPGGVKKMMGIPEGKSVSGGGIYLYRGSPKLIGVAEGVETAMAVASATDICMVSTVNSALMENFQPPEHAEHVIIWADKDRTYGGLNSAKVLKERLWGNGIKAMIRLPEQDIPDGQKSMDWNDVLQYHGTVYFRKQSHEEKQVINQEPKVASESE